MATQETLMLDAYVIEEIKRRERDRSRDDRPAVELPLPAPPPPGRPPDREDDDRGDRGVVIIDYSSSAAPISGPGTSREAKCAGPLPAAYGMQLR